MTLSSVPRVCFVTLLLIIAFAAGQQSARSVSAQTRQRWEYQTIRKRNDQLNKLGEDGWEAVNMTDNDFVLLKRSK